MDLSFFAAPMQGYADAVWRRAHEAVYGPLGGGADRYFTPFIRVEAGGVRGRDMRGLRASLRDLPGRISAQVIFRDLDELRLLADAVAVAGCSDIDLNLGCPYPMQTRKGRGAAAIENPGLLAEAAAEMRARPGIRWSAKIRLGLYDPEAWRCAAAALADMPLQWLTVHPRVASQGYKGVLYDDQIEAIADAIGHPIIFNGDLLAPADIAAAMSRYPSLRGVMIGRGLMARPSLIAEWRTGEEWDRCRRLQHIRQMHDMMLQAYTDTIEGGAHQVLSKMMTFWEYLEPEIGHRAYKSLKKSQTLAVYAEAARSALALSI